MAAYRRVYDSHHLQTDCQEPGSAQEPYARQSNMSYLYLFYRLRNGLNHLQWCDFVYAWFPVCLFNPAFRGWQNPINGSRDDKYQLSLIDLRDRIMLYTELITITCDKLQRSSVGARRCCQLSWPTTVQFITLWASYLSWAKSITPFDDRYAKAKVWSFG